MATAYGFRNTTGSPIDISSKTSIAAGATWIFYNAFTLTYYEIVALQNSMISNPTGLNYLLMNSHLIYVIDGVDQSPSSFYSFWASFYNIQVAPQPLVPKPALISTADGSAATAKTLISTGVADFAPPSMADNSNGTVSITSSNVNLYDNATFQNTINVYDIEAATITLTSGLQQYVVVDYNSGTPYYRVENTRENINSSNIVGIYVVWLQGTKAYYRAFDSLGLALPNKTERALLDTEPYRISVAGGLVLSETSTPLPRTVLVSSAVVYGGVIPYALASFNSSVNQLNQVNHVAGVWTYTVVSQYATGYYDDGTNLVTFSNKYSVVWFYRGVDSTTTVFYVFGTDKYNSTSEAALEEERADLPSLLRGFCYCVGRIIVKEGATSGLVGKVATKSFVAVTVQSHNDLVGLHGGSIVEYYHLSLADYNSVSTGVWTKPFNLPASTTLAAPLTLPHGDVPLTLSDGAIWTTATGVYSRIAGATVKLNANGALYYASSTVVSVANTTTQTSLIPGSSPLTPASQTPGNITAISADGTIVFSNTAHIATFVILLDSVTLVTFTVVGTDIIGLVVGTSYHWKLNAKLAATAAPSTTSTVTLYGTFEVVAAGGSLIVDLMETATVNTTVTNAFDFRTQWSNAAPANATTCSIAVMQQVNSIGGDTGGSKTVRLRNTTGNTILPVDYCIRYTGNVDVTFPLPLATGSARVLKFIHAGSASARLFAAVSGEDTINGDSSMQLSKYTNTDSVSVEIIDADVGIWNIFG